MNKDLDINHTCRACRRTDFVQFCDLGVQPPANYFLRPEQLYQPERFAPLQVVVCTNCWLVQLEFSEPHDELFSDDYAYFSSFSDSWLEHSRRLAADTAKELSLSGTAHVLEIASNDGYLLNFFQELGMRVLGIEPSSNVAQAALDRGIPTQVEFFNGSTAVGIARDHGEFDLVCGLNVLAHVPDLGHFVAGIGTVLERKRGAALFEFPHLLELVENRQFDTIYHEHFSYLSVSALRPLLADHGLRIFDVKPQPTHGGSLRLLICHAEAKHEQSGAVDQVLEREIAAGLTSQTGFSDFAQAIGAVKRDLLRFLLDAQESGATVVGYGAPAKGNTMLNFAGVKSDLIQFTVDRSPQKQGRFLPGSRIPVLSPDAIRPARPDYLLVLPWNLAPEIADQCAYIGEWGGKFVTAVPELRVFDPPR